MKPCHEHLKIYPTFILGIPKNDSEKVEYEYFYEYIYDDDYNGQYNATSAPLTSEELSQHKENITLKVVSERAVSFPERSHYPHNGWIPSVNFPPRRQASIPGIYLPKVI